LALSVPLSRFTPRVGGGSAFFVRPLTLFLILTELIWLAMIGSRSISMSKLPIVRMVLARAGLCGGQVRSRHFGALIL
jgi:hypothetical protein